jgi:hypothetical protein
MVKARRKISAVLSDKEEGPSTSKQPEVAEDCEDDSEHEVPLARRTRKKPRLDEETNISE